MELPIRAAVGGTVRAVHCREGELVQPGVTLIEIDGRDEPPDASRSSKWGRATDCRTSAAAVATADKVAFVDRLSAAGLAGHRSVGVRQPEVGAADGRRGRGLRRHRAAARRSIHGARPQPRRARSRARRGRARDRDLRRSVRDVQPEEHQSVDRRLARHLSRRVRARGGSSRARARVRLDRVRLSVRRRTCRPSAWSRESARRSSRWAPSRCRSATPSASRIPVRCRSSSTP